MTLWKSDINTPLGEMIAIADQHHLLLLEFIGRRHLGAEMEKLCRSEGAVLKQGSSKPLEMIQKELERYFAGRLSHFKTPTRLIGTAFQVSVWNALSVIGMGSTFSYTNVAQQIGRPTAVRAVGNAVGANQLALVVPCHRVVETGGGFGGYAAGLEKKKWLLQHEKENHDNTIR